MMKIRNKIFWIIDCVKGNIFKNELEEISECLSLHSKLALDKMNAPKLNLLLNLAVENSNFYKKYKNYNSLSNFPVITKTVIKENLKDFHIAKENLENLKKVNTSGSTGTPFTIYQSKSKKIRNTADTIYFSKAAGFTIGDQLLYLGLWNASSKNKPIDAKLRNIKELDVRDLNGGDYMQQLVASLQKDRSSKGWLGYASGFETICQYLDKVNSPRLDCNIKSIIAMSEYLCPIVKTKMEYYFQCPTVSRYSNEENGIIAQQLPDETNFTINWASYIVEILNMDNDTPVADGEVGRIIVTDLYNYATVMIRYDTGDIGSFDSSKSDTIPKFNNIQGRKMDALYTTDGKLVNPFVLCFQVDEFQELDQIQYIQISKKGYTIKVNSKNNFKRESELLSLFKSEIGNDAEVSIEYVNEIPSLKSGKRKLTVNLYKN